MGGGDNAGMHNTEGINVDLYIPRKWCAHRRIRHRSNFPTRPLVGLAAASVSLSAASALTAACVLFARAAPRPTG